MIGLLAEVGKKIADRWLSVLLLPGLLFAAAVTCAWLLGHGHAFDVRRLAESISARIRPLDRQPVQIAVVAVAVVLLATASAYAAQALTGVVNAVWTARRPKWIVNWRCGRAERRRPGQPKPYLPARLTPAGDHWRLVGARVAVHYNLDLNRVWPRLWLLVASDTRTVVQTAYGAYHSALTLAGWGLLYTALGCWWWPAAVAGLGAVALACRRGAQAAAAAAQLIEAVVDLNVKALATAIDADQSRAITDAGAVRIANVLAKRQLF